MADSVIIAVKLKVDSKILKEEMHVNETLEYYTLSGLLILLKPDIFRYWFNSG